MGIVQAACPLGGRLARIGADRILVADDAGGFVSAYTDEGNCYAMVTSRHAGEVATPTPR